MFIAFVEYHYYHPFLPQYHFFILFLCTLYNFCREGILFLSTLSTISFLFPLPPLPASHPVPLKPYIPRSLHLL